MHAETIAYQLELSQKVVQMNTRDVSHEDSLVPPPLGGSCLNQVLGHLVRTRNLALQGLGRTPLFPVQEFDAYDDERGSTPFSPETAIRFEELKRRFELLQIPIVELVRGMSDEDLRSTPSRKLTEDPTETVGCQLAKFVFHECYHVGQTGILRRIAGKAGVVKPPR